MCKKCWAAIKKLEKKGDDLMRAYCKAEDEGKFPSRSDFKCASPLWQEHRLKMDKNNEKVEKAAEKLRKCKGD